METVTKSTVLQIPISKMLSEAESQKARRVQEVMEALFSRLPDTIGAPDFKLADGTQCFIKKFHPPREDERDGIIYGFDVKFSPGSPLVHLEFSVRCAGWERAI